jgi:hypothetical protein
VLIRRDITYQGGGVFQVAVSVSDVDFVNHLVHLSQSVLHAWWFSSQQDQMECQE